jgi:hypothetical protein
MHFSLQQPRRGGKWVNEKKMPAICPTLAHSSIKVIDYLIHRAVETLLSSSSVSAFKTIISIISSV